MKLVVVEKTIWKKNNHHRYICAWLARKTRKLFGVVYVRKEDFNRKKRCEDRKYLVKLGLLELRVLLRKIN